METVQLGIPVTASNVLVRKYVDFIFKFLQSSNHPAVEFDLCFLCSTRLTNVLLLSVLFWIYNELFAIP